MATQVTIGPAIPSTTTGTAVRASIYAGTNNTQPVTDQREIPEDGQTTITMTVPDGGMIQLTEIS